MASFKVTTTEAHNLDVAVVIWPCVAVVEVTVPPLRERAEDIPTIAQFLLGEIAKETGREALTLEQRAVQKLLRYRWPGNVRELRNVLSRASVLAEGDRLKPEDIELGEVERGSSVITTRAKYEQEEERRILAALNTHRWNVSKASRLLDIPRTTLYRKIKTLRLSR